MKKNRIRMYEVNETGMGTLSERYGVIYQVGLGVYYFWTGKKNPVFSTLSLLVLLHCLNLNFPEEGKLSPNLSKDTSHTRP